MTSTLEWALAYPVGLSARAVLVRLTTLADDRTVNATATEISVTLGVPKRTVEDALNRLIKAEAITGKRGKYKLRYKRIRTPVKSKPKLKRKAQKREPVRVDTAPVWWITLRGLAIDKRKGHVGLEPDDLTRVTKWLDENKITLAEAEDAADKIAARWPIKNQKVLYRIFYTYCRYQIRDRERNRNNGKTGLRKFGPSVHARRVTPGGISDPFKDFASAENS